MLRSWIKFGINKVLDIKAYCLALNSRELLVPVLRVSELDFPLTVYFSGLNCI